jgi:hypothetical protein
VKKNKPIEYRIYDYLKKNAIGYENRIKGNKLMQIFGINDNKTLREHIKKIRDSSILQKIVCSEAGSGGGYWMPITQEEVYLTLQHLYKRSMKMLSTYATIKRKSKLNNQRRFKLGKYEKEVYESLMEDKKSSLTELANQK